MLKNNTSKYNAYFKNAEYLPGGEALRFDTQVNLQKKNQIWVYWNNPGLYFETMLMISLNFLMHLNYYKKKVIKNFSLNKLRLE